MKNLILLMMLFVNSAQAKEVVYRNKLNTCKLTKQFMNNYEPSEFNTTNNLLRNVGEEPLYCGEKIIIKGTLLDENCVPVSNAKIYLWQAGCDGKYPYKPLRTTVSEKQINIHNGSSFTGSGTATSDNRGEFYFVTINPSKPINVRVQHRELGTLQTQLQLNRAAQDRQRDQGQSKHYNFRIVMPGSTLKSY